MGTSYDQLAASIVNGLGGKANITKAYHCQTRLRFELADESLAQDDAISELDGVIQVLHSNGLVMVVIGPHVHDVFEAVEPLVDISSSTEDSGETKGKRNPVGALIDFIAGTFQPIIPALAGAGMIKAVMALLVVMGIISSTSQTYVMLNIFADAIFYFLPMLIAFCEAQKLKCNPVIAAAVAAMMLHPNWTSLVQAGDPVRFFDLIPFTLASYGSSVIPIILVIFVQSYVERFIDRAIPKAVNLVFVPLLTFLIMGTLAFSVLGPLGFMAGNYLASVFTLLAENAAWAPAMLVGGLLPVMVMFGIHNGIAPLGVMQMSQLGYDSIFGPGCLVSNMCQATAGAIAALRTKDSKTRSIAVSGAITAYMGVTEPILYGVNLPLKWPLISAMVGGACGGLYAGLTHAHRFATGSSGLPAVLLYIGDNTLQYMINIIIAMLIGCAVTAVVALVLSAHAEKGAATKVAASAEPVAAPTEEAPAVIASLAPQVVCPVAGTQLDLSQSADEVFASKMLGEGFVVEPSGHTVFAPFDGEVTMLFPTNHAVGVTASNGAEVMIHVGIDTVGMNGDGFTAHVAMGDHVVAGQPLTDFDVEKIAAAGLSTQVMVIVTQGPKEAAASQGDTLNFDRLTPVAN